MTISPRLAWTAFCSYRNARKWTAPNRSREDLERHQRNRLNDFLHSAIGKVDRYREFARPGVTLTDLPIIDKAHLMAEFQRFNVPRISSEQGWTAFSGSRTMGAYTVGASTGTSGNRGLFVVSQKERFLWLGAILAKAIPDFWRTRDKVAVVLPVGTPLYDSANETRLLQLKFFDLTDGPESWRSELERYDPSVIVAPPKILRWMAESKAKLRPRRIFSAAETLDPLDRNVIETAFLLKMGQIYMATEGLLAVSCHCGTLHLAEDAMHFELQDVGSGLVNPIITDFSRTTQIMARYRMNDLLRLAETPCPCGSPLLAVAEIVGRSDDCFEFDTAKGERIILTPDVLRNAVVDSDRRIGDYRIVRTEIDKIELTLADDLPEEAVSAASAALQALFKRRGISVSLVVERRPLTLDTSRKLRRVENRITCERK